MANPSKIVVTGALGHIGSRLVRAFPALFPGVEVLMLDNFLVQRYPSLFNLPEGARFRFVECDVTQVALEPLFRGAAAVVHLAAITDATSSFERAEEVGRVNLTATRRTAEACAAADVPLVIASSTSVYGTQDSQVDENCGLDELKPQSPYARTKLLEEALVMEKCVHNKLRAVIFRFGTIFGVSPGMRFHTAVNKFCWQAVMGVPLTVWKTAYHQKRPYLEVGDAVRAIAFAIQNDLFDGRIYNAVTVNATVHDVVEHIRAHVPDLELNFVESRIMNQLSYEVLNNRLTGQGFAPSGRMSQGIADTIALLENANRG